MLARAFQVTIFHSIAVVPEICIIASAIFIGSGLCIPLLTALRKYEPFLQVQRQTAWPALTKRKWHRCRT